MGVNSIDLGSWAGPDGEIGSRIVEQTEACLRAYQENPLLIEEHANIERATAQGGYGRRQIYELIQNGADELIKEPGGRIHVLLTEDALYCANEGTPITTRGVEAILSAALSVKRGDEIGRFGMGFKSVLGVTDLPDFFSRTGSFRFDGDWAGKKILAVKPDAERTPILRVAYPLDPEKATKSDKTLRGLMEWATTVVRLPIDRSESHWLAPEIRDFPTEFLLFSPHVGELTLEDRVEGVKRSVQLTPSDGQLLVTEGGETEAWKVFSRVHQPSREARREAGELADRKTIPIVWAVPTQGRRRTARGTFWAFFPTHYESTLSGILNAPWKTNEDRQNLLEGPFNEELLKEASQLIVDSLPEVAVPGDPGAHLDVMPARGREAPNWADNLITETVYELAANRPALPDQNAILQKPEDVHCHPGGLERDALDEWASYPGRPTDWCHPTIETRERRPRAERLLREVFGSPEDLTTWLEALVADESAEASIAALRTARRVLEADANADQEIKQSRVLKTNSGEFHRLDPDLVSLPGEYVSRDGDLPTVHTDVLKDPVAKTFLIERGFREGDPLQEIRGMVAAGPSRLRSSEDWEGFWRLTRQVSQRAVTPILDEADSFTVYAKAKNGDFKPIDTLLMPGPIVSIDRGEDSAVCLDTSFHEDDLELLQALGLLAAPRVGAGSQAERWFLEYVNSSRESFINAIDRNPHWRYLVFEDQPFVGPLAPLANLSKESAARFTRAALAADPEAEPWVMFHRTTRKNYPELEMPNPMIWLLYREGYLETSLGIKVLEEAVSSELHQWSDFLPVAEDIPKEQARLLEFPETLDELSADDWKAALGVANGVVDDRLRGRFYGMASRYRKKPAHILARVGKSHQLEEPAAVTAVTDEREMRVLADQGTPVLLCNRQDLEVLVSKWALSSGESKVKTTIEHTPASSPVPLADQWPLLAFVLPDERRDIELVSCESLRLVTTTEDTRNSEDIKFHLTESMVLYEPSLTEHEVLQRVVDELDLDLDEVDIGRVVEQRIEDEKRDDLEKIARIADPADRLTKAVGVEPLRRLAGVPLIESAERLRGGKLDDRTVASLVLAAHGVNTLKVLKEELEFWAPPTQWAGSRRAREFVSSLGFAETYAGFQSAQRDPLVPVDGPLRLPSLHAFQETISKDLRDLLNSNEQNRGLVSLPTGAGKTRVAVQTLVEAYKDGDIRGPILWVAQSDELCEQAVQAWREVWRSEGPESRMHVSRLWGTNEVGAVGHGLQVVVATIDKLQARHERPEYDWLREADCLLIDEAHRAITPEYTKLLEAFGMGRGKRGIPLIGLTATPFRGSERETQQLASRYGNRLLDVAILGEYPYAALQDMGVLAQVEHEILPGSEVDLSDDEREHLEKYERMPPSVEGRLGIDADRNEILLTSIGDLPDEWTVLLFAASVEHAQIMAALLTLEGIPAAAISGETEVGARRHYVDEFRSGNLRVLTNYNVLTQGFDAPAVRAVYVARPTFSTNLYQQMIGRGLRGPKNGGETTCRIVNVADNFLKFGEELAFHQFDYLWNRGE